MFLGGLGLNLTRTLQRMSVFADIPEGLQFLTWDLWASSQTPTQVQVPVPDARGRPSHPTHPGPGSVRRPGLLMQVCFPATPRCWPLGHPGWLGLSQSPGPGESRGL